MKRIILPTFIVAAGLILLASFITKRDGTDPGYTGSPGDNYNNCTTCHGGMATPQEGWISSDIPSYGYVPGQKYKVKASNYAHGATRFGFEVSPQAFNGDLMGTMIITDPLRTQLVGANKYITYRADGVDGQDSSSWSFDWIAPSAGSGDVVFYGAFNSNPGHKGGDGTTLSTLRVKEFGTTGMAPVADRITNFSLYPNPAGELVKLSFDLKASSNVTVDITDLKGNCVVNVLDGKQNGRISKEIDTKELATGTYLVRLRIDDKTAAQQLNVVH